MYELGTQSRGGWRRLSALIVCSFGVNENYILVDNPDYPEIAEDYVATFAKARALPVDVFLGAHPGWYKLAQKFEKMQNRQDGDLNPFIDRAGYAAHIDLQEARFLSMIEQQREVKRSRR